MGKVRVALAVAAAALTTVGVVVATSTPATSAPAVETVNRAAYVTAYTWFDNTPPGSADISHPIIHTKAGGVGTFTDPVTVAVGHDLHTGQDVLDYPAGTKMYIPDVRRYFIVEDTCGDGRRPENGPCHKLNAAGNRAPAGASTWVDIWIGGQGSTASKSNTCAEDLTALHTVIVNPPAGYVVAGGSAVLHDGRCDYGYGETAVLSTPVPSTSGTSPRPSVTVPTLPICAPAR